MHVTVRFVWGGETDPRFSADVIVAVVGDGVDDEVDFVHRNLSRLFVTPGSPWRVEAIHPDELGLPEAAHIRFIRQPIIALQDGRPGRHSLADLPRQDTEPGTGCSRHCRQCAAGPSCSSRSRRPC